jgi:3'-5' exoribonuclease
MVRLAVSIGKHYESYYPGLVSIELLVAGAVLHDIAKTWELKTVEAGYTTHGELVGHIAMGVELISEAVAEEEPNFDDGVREDLVIQLKHLVLSHHGVREWGSPIQPKTPEAILLWLIDMMDSRMGMAFEALEGIEPGNWTERLWALDNVRLFRRLPLPGEDSGQKGNRHADPQENRGPEAGTDPG